MDNKRRLLLGGGIVVLVALAAAVAWFGPWRGDDEPTRPGMDEGDPAAEAADAFAAAWVAGTLDQVPATEASGQVGDRALIATIGLGPGGRAPASVEVTGMRVVGPADAGSGGEDAPEVDPDAPARVAADLAITWAIDGDRSWSYESAVELVEEVAVEGADPAWLVDWTPTVVHPAMVEGDVLTTVRLAAPRGEILGPDGEPIVALRPVVQVGLEPGAASDPAGVARQVAGIVGVDAEALVARVEASPSSTFVSVVTLRQAAFDEVAGSLAGIPGVITRAEEIPLAPTRDFARALLGTVGPATPEIALASEGRVAEGETTGLSGLQAAQDDVLGGRPGVSIRVAAAEGREPKVLEDLPAEPGRSIAITIDERVQTAADQVMASAPKPAALVAIRPSTGEVLAVANGPAGADGYNRAMIGRYAPGSTFKVASTYGLLQGGLTPETIVPCPATIVVGKEFRNAEGEVLGDVPFAKDFADSCNTAFVGQSRNLPAQGLTDAAAALGFRPLDIGAPLALGSVPVTDSETEHAANMIGQGKVEASPFVVALMSASVAAGRSVEPRLVIDPDAPAPALGPELPPAVIDDLRGLMRGVVTDGTGSAVADVPGGEVFGKTGTAEYGTESPPRTHAWFTGFQGDVAFAVLVEDGGFGGQVAAPLAADFLELLAQG